jgi:large subunit ribosomal protein L31
VLCYNLRVNSGYKIHDLKEVKKMREGIHPEYHNDAVVKCACGNTFTTGSVNKELKVEICSKCHPFFTGRQKLVDVGGRVEKFRKKFNLKDEE